MIARVASPRLAAAVANSAVAGRTSRQLMGPPESRSSEAGSDHGQRAGTQSVSFDKCGGMPACPQAHPDIARQARTQTQPSPRIRIYLLLYDNGTLQRRLPETGSGTALVVCVRNCGVYHRPQPLSDVRGAVRLLGFAEPRT